MLKRKGGLFEHYDGPAPEATIQLEREGHCILRGLFRGDELKEMRREVEAIYAENPPDDRPGLQDPEVAEMFRYEMFNRSARCQAAMAHPLILAVLDPILGIDFHAVNSTAWRNPPGAVEAKDRPETGTNEESYFWHVDAGPHVPRARDVEWPDEIPYPIFVVATHIYLNDCELDDGPTIVIPGSHRSGRLPPEESCFDDEIFYKNQGPCAHLVEAGDVGFFVSDVWHRRRLPTAASRGRLFLQTNFGRRDIAQRIRPTEEVNHTTSEARARATTLRERNLIGLHVPTFYDG